MTETFPAGRRPQKVWQFGYARFLIMVGLSFPQFHSVELRQTSGCGAEMKHCA